MESFGAILKKTRTDKNLSLEIASRDTAITRRYLEALEDENLSVIPGETYVVGFIKNYGEYLGCDTKYLLKLYHAKIVQEAAIPEELLRINRHPWRRVAVIVLLVVAVVALGFGVFRLVLDIRERLAQKSQQISLVPREKQMYTLASQSTEVRVYQGDVLVVPLASGPVKVELDVSAGKLLLSTANGMQTVELGEELRIDVDGDGQSDMNVYVSDISLTDESRGAAITAFLLSGSEESQAKESELYDSSVFGGTHQVKVLLEDDHAYPFTFTATFRGNCLFRYQTDRNEAIQDYYTSGESVVASANNGVRLWMSNENSVKLQLVAGTHRLETEAAKTAQVMVEDIRWVKEAEGVYKLVVVQVD